MNTNAQFGRLSRICQAYFPAASNCAIYCVHNHIEKNKIATVIIFLPKNENLVKEEIFKLNKFQKQIFYFLF